MWEKKRPRTGLLLLSLFLFVSSLISVVLCQFAGDPCYHHGKAAAGVCKLLEQCPDAISDVKNRIRPQHCGFDKNDIIVCCVEDNTMMKMPVVPDYPKYDKPTTTKPVTTTTKSPLTTKQTTVTTTKTVTGKPGRKPGERSAQKCKEYEDLSFKTVPSPVLLFDNDEIKESICPWVIGPVIYHGTKCTPGEFPHMGLLKYRSNNTRCGGTLISEKFVLTAAHCLLGSDGPTSVRLGDLNVADPNDDTYVQEIKVKNVHAHRGFELPVQYNDIALLELEKPVALSVFVKPACLYTKKDFDFKRAIVTGWGKTENYVNSDDLLKAALDLFRKEECEKSFNSYSSVFPKGVDYDVQLCAGSYTSEKDSCRGDSGGPLQIYAADIECSHYVIGVTSFGIRCGVTNLPAVYTKVYPYLEWIEDIVWP